VFTGVELGVFFEFVRCAAAAVKGVTYLDNLVYSVLGRHGVLELGICCAKVSNPLMRFEAKYKEQWLSSHLKCTRVCRGSMLISAILRFARQKSAFKWAHVLFWVTNMKVFLK